MFWNESRLAPECHDRDTSGVASAVVGRPDGDEHRPMPDLKLLPLLTVVAALAATPAHAETRTTNWYTIDVPAGVSDRGAFLTTDTDDGVSLDRYFPGAPHSQWTPVYQQWPGSIPVTGHGPLEGITGCTFSGCPFTGAGGTPRKFVNRLTGRCLTFLPTADGRGTTVELRGCTASGRRQKDQLIDWFYTDAEVSGPSGIPQLYTPLAHQRADRQVRCLSMFRPKNRRTVRGIGSRCVQGSTAIHQRFRFLRVAQVTCDIGVTTNICGLPRR